LSSPSRSGRGGSPTRTSCTRTRRSAVGRFVKGVHRTADLGPDDVAIDRNRAEEEGWAGHRDERLWYLARMRLNLPGLARLSELIAGQVAADRGAERKVIEAADRSHVRRPGGVRPR
jgi:hypothetical protein